MRETRDYLENLFNYASAPIIIWDPQFRITGFNRAFERLTGRTTAEVVGKGLDILFPEDRRDESLAQIRGTPTPAGEQCEIVEIQILNVDGTVRTVLWNSATLYGADGKTAIATIALGQDITERRRAEERHREAERQLQKQRMLSLHADRLRSLGEMAAGMAHELSQPLVGVRGIAEHILIALTRGWSLPHEKISEKVKLIVDQADRMEHIIQHVRTFAREAGRPEVQLVHINDVVKSSLELLEAELRNHEIEVECRPAEDLPQVVANPFSLEEVMLNLLTNARDAIEARTGEDRPAPPHIRVRTFAVKKGKQRLVSILLEDCGVGIPSEILTKVFDPFFTTKGPDKGTGLGLAISRSIVGQFGGHIEIQSTAGHGTSVTVSLPAYVRSGQGKPIDSLTGGGTDLTPGRREGS